MARASALLVLCSACDNDQAKVANCISLGFVFGILFMGAMFLSFLDVWMRMLGRSDGADLARLNESNLLPELAPTRSARPARMVVESHITEMDTRS